MSNPGSDDLKRVAELTNIIQMDHACNIQFTSGDINTYVGFKKGRGSLKTV